MTKPNSSQTVIRRKRDRLMIVPEKPKAKTVAARAAAARLRKKANGQPAVAAFDRMLREIVCRHYKAGLPCDAPDSVRATIEQLTASGEHTGRGSRATVTTLMAMAGGVDADEPAESPEDVQARRSARQRDAGPGLAYRVEFIRCQDVQDGAHRKGGSHISACKSRVDVEERQIAFQI